MPSSTPPELLTPEEIAKMLKVSVRQFLERVSKRSGFPARLNHQIMKQKHRWKKTDIINWIENGGHES